MLREEPGWGEQLGRERVGLNLSSIIMSLTCEERTVKNFFLIKARLVAESLMAKFVRRRKSLDGKRALRRHHDPLVRLIHECAEQVIERLKHHRDIALYQHGKDVDSALTRLGARPRVELPVEPLRLIDGVQDVLTARHESPLLLLLADPQKISEPC